MAKLHVSTTINGEPAEFLCEPSDTMLDALRGPLGLTGSKEGCASGDCGACSITLDDRLVCSCLMLAAEAEGHEIAHHRGHGAGRQAASAAAEVPGNGGAAVWHLHARACWSPPTRCCGRIRDPSEEEVRFWLAGNLCRCTGYDKIVRAVLETAADMQEAAEQSQR